jgi:hypothetical protein
MSFSRVKYDMFPPSVRQLMFSRNLTPNWSELELTEEAFVRRRMRRGTPSTPVGSSWLETLMMASKSAFQLFDDSCP